jgi:hypothetical protein
VPWLNWKRSLIVEWVRAGLRNAKVIVDARRIAVLRKSGASWATICNETGLSKGTAQRAIHSLPKNHPVTAPVSPYAVAAGLCRNAINAPSSA